MQRQRTASPVDVNVPGDAPSDHLQVVDSDAFLQQVVTLFIVYQKNVFAVIKERFTLNFALSLKLISYLRGIWLRRPSRRCTVTRGFARRASKTMRIFFLV